MSGPLADDLRSLADMSVFALPPAGHRETLRSAASALDVLIPFARWADEYLDEPCRFDHDGHCQSHGLDEHCPVGSLREWLHETEGAS